MMVTTYQLLNATSEEKKSQKQRQTYMQEKKSETTKFKKY